MEYGELHAHRLVTGVDEQSQLVADEKTAESNLRRALKQVKKKTINLPNFFRPRGSSTRNGMELGDANTNP